MRIRGAAILLAGLTGCSSAVMQPQTAPEPVLEPIAIELPSSTTRCAGEVCFTYADDGSID